MATENLLLCMSLLVSGNNLSAVSDKYIFCKCGATEGDVVPSSNENVPLGISQETGKDGEVISVGIVGISKLRLVGTIKAGNLVKAYTGPADGRGVASTNIGAYGAMALEDGVTGDIISVLLTQGHGS